MVALMASEGHFRSPGQLLDELGITNPEDIDIEAIAFYCKATIRYRALTGCAACIVGNGDTAIITVDSAAPRGRQRFSAGHELGHWMHDRGKAAFSCQDRVMVREWSAQNPESRANRYASDLLLPVPLFKPRASVLKKVDFDAVRTLATAFTTSLTATAIRLVEHGPLPAVLVCYSDSVRRWFARRSSIPDKLWPHQQPQPHSYAFDLCQGAAESELRGEVRADAWFDHRSAEGHYIHEHSLRTSYGDVLSILWWKDERMLIELEEYEERLASRRSDWRSEE